MGATANALGYTCFARGITSAAAMCYRDSEMGKDGFACGEASLRGPASRALRLASALVVSQRTPNVLMPPGSGSALLQPEALRKKKKKTTHPPPPPPPAALAPPPALVNASVETVLSCAGVGSGSISCLSVASFGEVAGSCSSCDGGIEDNGCVAYLPADVGAACIGQPSCTVETKAADGTVAVDGVSAPLRFVQSDDPSVSCTPPPTIELRILAYCGAPDGVTSSLLRLSQWLDLSKESRQFL